MIPQPHPFLAAFTDRFTVVTRGAAEAPFAEVCDSLDAAADSYAECRDWGIPVQVFRGDDDIAAEVVALIRSRCEARGLDLPDWIEARPWTAAEWAQDAGDNDAQEAR